MRKLIVSEFVSLDGVMEAPGGEEGFEHSGWVLDHGHDEEGGAFKLKETMEADALLLGRVTYEGFAKAWPERSGDFADKFNTMQKYVVSTTLTEPLEWENSTLISGDVAEELAKLKEGDGGPILLAGSRTLVHTLYEHDLVDEYRIMVFPVVLGSGRRLFPDDAGDKRKLELVDSKTFGNGVVVQTYHPA
jgi:dihydrofolate reductase